MLKSQMTSTKAYTTVGLYISAKNIFFLWTKWYFYFWTPIVVLYCD